MSRDFLSVAQFSTLTGLCLRAARLALQAGAEKRLWRDTLLEVRRVRSRGGSRGWSYEVARDSIPPHLLRPSQPPLIVPSEAAEAALTAGAEPAPQTLPAASPASTPATINPLAPVAYPRSRVTGDHQQASWRLAIVQQVIHTTAPRTAERAALTVEVARGVTQDWRGRPVTLSDRTLRDWIARYERSGMEGLTRKAPKNAGQRRVLLSRPWDKAIRELGLPEAAIADMVAKVRKRVRGEWAAGTPSWPTVQMNCLPFVVGITREAGVAVPDLAMHRLCEVPRRFIERERYPFTNIAIRRNDAAGFAAKITPRIVRYRSTLRPGDWVAGDVHHLDILFRCPDGRVVTPKAIAWLDLATNRARIDIVIPEPNQNVRREQIIQSFISMCADPDWGAPSRLYIDNGREYSRLGFFDDIAKLKHRITCGTGADLIAEGIGVHRARPYNPQGKVIEWFFSTLEGTMYAQFRGWIGGDRMRKKTANQGRSPDPFPGDEQRLNEALAKALNYYHHKRQTGHLNGISPNDSFRAFVAQGWTATVLDDRELAVAFSEEFLKPVRSGGTIRLEKQNFRADELQSLVGQRVLVRQPLYGDRTTLFVFTEFGDFLAIARPDIVFPFGDTAGAKEQARRAKLLKADLTAAEAIAEPAAAGGERAMAALYGPAPQAQRPDAVISINPEFSEAARMAKDAPGRAEEEADRKLTARNRKSSFLSRLAASCG